MTFLWRAKGSPEPQAAESPFSDVSASDWFYKPALWAYENGVATGTAFNPGNSCTNGEALTFLWRAEGKPTASVYHSAVALAASGQYYARPAAWAEANGLFFGGDFDPAAPCSRAELMMYLHWVTKEWTFAEEDKAVQAEFEQIINDAQLYEVHGSGLCFANYVDVDSDGKVELLTVGISDYKLTATVYADMNGQVEKSCEGTIDAFVGNRVAGFSLCKADGHLYLYATGWYVEGAGRYYNYMDQFYQIGKGAVSLEYDFSSESEYIEETDSTKYTYTISGNKVAEGEFKTALEKFTDIKEFCTLDIHGFATVGISERGLLPDPSAVMQKIYEAAKNGDFSFFAGTYRKSFGDSFSEKLTLNKDGTLSGGNDYNTANNQKPVSITVTSKGIIRCVITPVGLDNHYDEWSTTWHGDIYDICPIGIEWDELAEVDGDVGLIHNITTDTNSLRIVYTNWGGSAGADTGVYYK